VNYSNVVNRDNAVCDKIKDRYCCCTLADSLMQTSVCHYFCVDASSISEEERLRISTDYSSCIAWTTEEISIRQ